MAVWGLSAGCWVLHLVAVAVLWMCWVAYWAVVRLVAAVGWARSRVSSVAEVPHAVAQQVGSEICSVASSVLLVELAPVSAMAVALVVARSCSVLC